MRRVVQPGKGRSVSGALLLVLLSAVQWSPTARGGDPADAPSASYGEPGVTASVRSIMARPGPERRVAMPIPPAAEHPRRDLPVGRDPEARPVAQWPLPPAPAAAFPGNDPDATAAHPAAPQAIGLGFKAIALADSGAYPPDPSGDVGPEQILVATNGRIRVFDRAGTVGALDTLLETFFDDVRAFQSVSQPHVRYDRLSGRWFVAAITSGFPNRVVIAMSSGSVIDDASSFTFFFFVQDAVPPLGQAGQKVIDLSMGVDKFALYFGGNVVNSSGIFTASSGYLVRKASLLAGGPPSAQAFRGIGTVASGGLWAPRGVDNDDPAATQGYFIGVDIRLTGRLVLRRVTNPGGTPSTLSANINITVPDTALPMSVPTGGSTFPLESWDDRLFAARVGVNRITGERSLWTAHNIRIDATGTGTTGGDRDGARWYEIRNLGAAAPLVFQAGTLFDEAAEFPRYFFIPSIAMSGQGHAAIGTSTSGENYFADAAVAGRLADDAAGATQPFAQATFSGTPYDDGFSFPEYWGSKSATVVDPNDAMTMWTVQEWCDDTNSWGVQVVQLIAPPPATPASASSVCAGLPSASVTVTGTSVSGSGFFDPGPDTGGPGFPNHIQAAIGGGITVDSVAFDSPTQVTLQVSTVGASMGAHDVTITNPDGQSATGTGVLDVVGAPATPAAGADSPVCAGGTLQLTASTISGATYAWTGPNGFTSSQQNPVLIGVDALAAGTYSVTASAAGCSSAEGSVVVSVIDEGGTCAGCGLCEAGACVTGDSDSDGVGNGCDCAPGNPEAWDLPGDASGPTLTHAPPGTGGTTTLVWSAPATGGLAAGMTYDVLRSAAASDFVGAGVCLESDGADLQAADPEAPAPGAILFYVVRAQNACGAGVSHRDGAGVPRPARDCP